MSASLDELGPKAADVVPIFVTLDPERDTPEVMADYVKNFGPRFVGLTGSPEEIAEAAKAYRVAFSKFDKGADDNGNYSIDHSALAYLMGKDGEYITHFKYGTPAAKMAETLRRYLDQAGGDAA
jgi:protein SCO1/2